MQYGFLKEHGGFAWDEAARRFRLDYDKLEAGLKALVAELVRLEGDGDYAGARAFLDRYGGLDPEARAVIATMTHIPVDIQPIYPPESEARSEPDGLSGIVDGVVKDVSAYRGQGQGRRLYSRAGPRRPEQARHRFVLEDGSSSAAGDADEPFSIQSISYVFALSLALHQQKSALWNHVGREPSGSRVQFDLQLEIEQGKPRNPMTNAGAIVVCDQLIGADGADEAIEEMIGFLRERGGRRERRDRRGARHVGIAGRRLQPQPRLFHRAPSAISQNPVGRGPVRLFPASARSR